MQRLEEELEETPNESMWLLEVEQLINYLKMQRFYRVIYNRNRGYRV